MVQTISSRPVAKRRDAIGVENPSLVSASEKRPSNGLSLPPASFVKTGRKRALLIGCKYENDRYWPELQLPHEDIMKVRAMLISKLSAFFLLFVC